MAKATVKSRHVLTPKPMTAEGKAVMPSILKAVLAGVEEAASQKNTLSVTAVEANKPVIRSETRAAIEASPEFQHLSNTEPWWQSRVTVGSIVAVIAGVAGGFGYVFPEVLQTTVVNVVVTGAPIVGGLFALWGRWAARKPLGA